MWCHSSSYWSYITLVIFLAGSHSTWNAAKQRQRTLVRTFVDGWPNKNVGTSWWIRDWLHTQENWSRVEVSKTWRMLYVVKIESAHGFVAVGESAWPRRRSERQLARSIEAMADLETRLTAPDVEKQNKSFSEISASCLKTSGDRVGLLTTTQLY